MLEDFSTSFDAHIALDKAKLFHPSDNNPAACWRHRYSRLLTDAHGCSRMLTYADVW
jgi:hypothetical protein